jgi:hypothetical protein
VPPLFVQVIVVPAATVIVDGLKELLWIQTSFTPGPPEPPGFPPPPPMLYIELDFEQLMEMLKTVISMPILINNLFFELIDFFMISMFI